MSQSNGLKLRESEVFIYAGGEIPRQKNEGMSQEQVKMGIV